MTRSRLMKNVVVHKMRGEPHLSTNVLQQSRNTIWNSRVDAEKL